MSHSSLWSKRLTKNSILGKLLPTKKKILQKMKKGGTKEKLYVGRRTNKSDGWPS